MAFLQHNATAPATHCNLKGKIKMQKQPEIAVRLYENAKFGTTYAKGLYHSAVFNASADVLNPSVKYLMDFYTLERWQHTARTDGQMVTLNIVCESEPSDALFSWILRYDCTTKAKTLVDGFASLDPSTNKLKLLVDDTAIGLAEGWTLTAKPCRSVSGKKSPALLATNADLSVY
jgi:hypothetical protein